MRNFEGWLLICLTLKPRGRELARDRFTTHPFMKMDFDLEHIEIQLILPSSSRPPPDNQQVSQ